MDILYLAHRLPYPPDKGDKLRAFRQIEHLSRRHRVWCACFVDSPADRAFVEPLRRHCHRLAVVSLNRRVALIRGLGGWLGGGTVTESFYRHAGMSRVLRRWRHDVAFDVVIAFSSSMAPYASAVQAGRRVLDLCDRDSLKWLDYAARSTGPMRFVYESEGRRLAAKERAWAAEFDAAVLITESEAASLRKELQGDKRTIAVVGNGVILPDLGASCASFEIGRRSRSVPVVGFVGVMNYFPNVDAVRWFVSACWPGIREIFPTALFRIVGRSPTRGVRRLARMPGVEVIGGVENVSVEVRRFDVSVAPLRIARGLQNKVLEAMAHAKPVVLTRKAAQGLAARAGRDFLVADDPAAIIGAVSLLLRNPAERSRIGAAARRFVEQNHRWEEELEKFERVVGNKSEAVSFTRINGHSDVPA